MSATKEIILIKIKKICNLAIKKIFNLNLCQLKAWYNVSTPKHD